MKWNYPRGPRSSQLAELFALQFCRTVNRLAPATQLSAPSKAPSLSALRTDSRRAATGRILKRNHVIRIHDQEEAKTDDGVAWIVMKCQRRIDKPYRKTHNCKCTQSDEFRYLTMAPELICYTYVTLMYNFFRSKLTSGCCRCGVRQSKRA